MQRLTLDIFDKHVLGEFVYALLHPRFNWQNKLVLRKSRNYVKVVTSNQFSRTKFSR